MTYRMYKENLKKSEIAFDIVYSASIYQVFFIEIDWLSTYNVE